MFSIKKYTKLFLFFKGFKFNFKNLFLYYQYYNFYNHIFNYYNSLDIFIFNEQYNIQYCLENKFNIKIDFLIYYPYQPNLINLFDFFSNDFLFQRFYDIYYDFYYYFYFCFNLELKKFYKNLYLLYKTSRQYFFCYNYSLYLNRFFIKDSIVCVIFNFNLNINLPFKFL